MPLVEQAMSAADKLRAGFLLTDTELAEFLGVSLKTVRNWRTKHEGPRFSKVGRRMVRYAPEDVLSFVGPKAGA